MSNFVSEFVRYMEEDLQRTENEYAFEDETDPRIVEGTSDECLEAIEDFYNRILDAIPDDMLESFSNMIEQTPRFSFGFSAYLSIIGAGSGIWDSELTGDRDYKMAQAIDDIITDLWHYPEFYIGDDGLIYC